MTSQKILRVLLITAGLLLVPLVAMQFSDGARWSLFDFVLAGVLLSGTGFLYELVASRAGNLWHKLAVALSVGTGLMLIWVNLSVGFIGSENNPANLLYLGVIAVGLTGAIVGRFEPRGLARAMFATAGAHALVGVITMIAGLSRGDALTRTTLANGCFVLLWAGSGLLFRHASKTVRGV